MAGEVEPYDNPPVRQANGQLEPDRCEVRVYSNLRWDFGGHQCLSPARWRIADYDKWGDIIVCGRHKKPQHGRSTHHNTLYGHVAGEPTSWRFQRTKGGRT